MSIVASAAGRGSSTGLWGVRFDDGSYLRVDTGSSDARKVEIDGDSRVAKVADALTMVTLDSLWPSLEHGTHEGRMELGRGAASMAWMERYL